MLLNTFSDLSLNLVAEAIGIAATVFFIDRIIKRQEESRRRHEWLAPRREMYADWLREIDDLLRDILERGVHYEEKEIFLPWDTRQPFKRVRIIIDLKQVSEMDALLGSTVSDKKLDLLASLRKARESVESAMSTANILAGSQITPEIAKELVTLNVKLKTICETLESSRGRAQGNGDATPQLELIAQAACAAKYRIEEEVFPPHLDDQVVSQQDAGWLNRLWHENLFANAWYRSALPFTVLESERAFEFQDENSDRASLTYRQTVRINKNGIQEFWWWLGSTEEGGRIANILIDNETPKMTARDDSGSLRVARRFEKPLKAGDRLYTTLTCDFVNTFNGNPAYLSFKIVRKTKKEILKVRFNERRKCRSTEAYLSYGGKAHTPLDEPKPKIIDNGSELHFQVSEPRLSEDYRIQWTW